MAAPATAARGASAEAVLHLIHDNAAWVAPFRTEVTRRGVALREWDLSDAATLAAVDVSTAPPAGVFFNRASASAHTRGVPHAMEHASTLVSWAESHGRRVLGGSRALSLESSKARQEGVFARWGLTTPNTRVIFSDPATGRPSKDAVENALAAISSSTSPRVVLKPSRGGSGAGVHILDNADAARKFLSGDDFDASESVDGTWLVQEFVDSPEACLYRLEFVGGKLVYAVRVDTADVLTDPEGVRNCPADSCDDKRQAAKAAPAAPEASDAGFAGLAMGATFALPSTGSAAPSLFDMSGAAVGPATPRFELGGGVGNCPMTKSTSKFVIQGEDFTDALIPQIEKMLVAEGIDVCGVEIVRDGEGKSYIIDMNCCNSNYNTRAEKKAGIGRKRRAGARKGGAESVLDLMLWELERAYGPRALDVARGEVSVAEIEAPKALEPEAACGSGDSISEYSQDEASSVDVSSDSDSEVVLKAPVVEADRANALQHIAAPAVHAM